MKMKVAMVVLVMTVLYTQRGKDNQDAGEGCVTTYPMTYSVLRYSRIAT